MKKKLTPTKKQTVKTIHDIIKNCKKGAILSDGLRTWKVVHSYEEDGDAVIATPHNWDKEKMGQSFELWDDAQARVTYLPNLKVVKIS